MIAGRDDRPRVHIWPGRAGGVTWTIGLREKACWAPSAGRALDDALACLDRPPGGGFVVIGGPSTSAAPDRGR